VTINNYLEILQSLRSFRMTANELVILSEAKNLKSAKNLLILTYRSLIKTLGVSCGKSNAHKGLGYAVNSVV